MTFEFVRFIVRFHGSLLFPPKHLIVQDFYNKNPTSPDTTV